MAVGFANTLVVTNAGAVYCAGNNGEGECGVSSATTPIYAFQAVPGMSSGVTQIAAANSAVCALMSDATVKCWGAGGDGKTGTGTFNLTGPDLPATVAGLTGVTQIASTGFAGHFCALKSDGTVWCWGVNYQAQLGLDPTTTPGVGDADGAPAVNVPTQVPGITGALSVAVGDGNTCVIKADHTVWCWGKNVNGELAVNPTATTTQCDVASGNPFPCTWTPVQIGTITATQVAFGDSNACAILTSGDIACWGYDSFGAMGKTTSTNTYQLTPGPTARTFTNTKSLACWGGSGPGCLAVDGDGSSWVWGENGQEELAQDPANVGDTVSNVTTDTGTGPIPVAGIPATGAAKAFTSNEACILFTDGTSWCWGDDSESGFGDQGNGNTYIPVQLSGF